MVDLSRNDLRTQAYVLRRTNFGEADRILNLITSEGKVSAIARGVRKEKSKLAGGIEMFSLIDINVHYGKSELAVVTSAKMLKYYGGILKDFSRMELAGVILKKISLAAESSDNPEYFKIVDLCFEALNRGVAICLVESWFWLNLARATGEEINLYRDNKGEKLVEDLRYSWDGIESALMADLRGEIDADIIKIMRLMLATEIRVVERVKGVEEKCRAILKIARAVNKV